MSLTLDFLVNFPGKKRSIISFFESDQSDKQGEVFVNRGVAITQGSCLLAQRTRVCKSERITEPLRT